MIMDQDYLLAIQLQEQFDSEASRSTLSDEGDRDGQSSKKRRVSPGSGAHVHPERTMSIVDDSWETLDPNPDVRSMFLEFNHTFFWGKLAGVEVKWSPRMTLCAGVCSYEGRGGLCSIRLSEPLLKLRPRRDLVQTLLHEMIHALLFVTQNNRDRDGHGPEFCKHMDRINQATGTKITVYHTFHDEVDLYRQHWWRCDGPCQSRKPYFGYVKRAMNRAPSSLDPWWGEHQRSCGGAYTKVKEPEGYGKKGKRKGEGSKEGKSKGEGSKEGKASEDKPTASRKPSSSTAGSGLQDIRNIIPFSGKGFLLGGASQPSTSSSTNKPSVHGPTPAVSSPVSPAKLRSPPALSVNKTAGSSGWLNGRSPIRGSSTSSPTGGAPSALLSKRPPIKKKSVSNTRVFVNINGSPVRIPKPSGQLAKPTSALPNTKQRSVQDLFTSRSLQTSAASSTVSKPPEEIQPRDPTSQSGAISSRKRSWDNRTSANIFDFFGKTMAETSSSSSTTSSRDGRQGGTSRAAPAPAPATSTPTVQASGSSSTSLTVSCPVCQVKVPEAKINEHLDSCLS